MSKEGSCFGCNSQNLQTVSVRRWTERYSTFKLRAAWVSYGLQLLGELLVLVFGDEADFTLLGNQQLGIGLLGMCLLV